MSTVLSELDDSLSGMSGTQVSQWVREKLPSGQGDGRTSDNDPKNDAEMLSFNENLKADSISAPFFGLLGQSFVC